MEGLDSSAVISSCLNGIFFRFLGTQQCEESGKSELSSYSFPKIAAGWRAVQQHALAPHTSPKQGAGQGSTPWSLSSLCQLEFQGRASCEVETLSHTKANRGHDSKQSFCTTVSDRGQRQLDLELGALHHPWKVAEPQPFQASQQEPCTVLLCGSEFVWGFLSCKY